MCNIVNYNKYIANLIDEKERNKDIFYNIKC